MTALFFPGKKMVAFQDHYIMIAVFLTKAN